MFELLIRGLFLATSLILFMPLFFGAITHETGGSSIYPFVIPIIGSIIIITLLLRKKSGYWLILISTLLSAVGMQQEQGSFLNYTLLGLGFFTLLFGCVVPKRW